MLTHEAIHHEGVDTSVQCPFFKLAHMQAWLTKVSAAATYVGMVM